MADLTLRIPGSLAKDLEKMAAELRIPVEDLVRRVLTEAARRT